MSEKEQPIDPTKERSGWDVLTNQSYTAEGWRKMMEERRTEFKEAVQQNAYEYAARLLLKGDFRAQPQIFLGMGGKIRR